jgi:hypothetical protein
MGGFGRDRVHDVAVPDAETLEQTGDLLRRLLEVVVDGDDDREPARTASRRSTSPTSVGPLRNTGTTTETPTSSCMAPVPVGGTRLLPCVPP